MDWSLLWDERFWLTVAAVLTLTLVSFWILRGLLGVVIARLRSRDPAAATGSPQKLAGFAAQMLSRTSRLLIFVFSLMIGLKLVELTPRWEGALSHGWFIALALQLALWLDCGVRLWMDSLNRDGETRNPVTTTIIGIMVRIVVWTLLLLSVLANLGVDITALVAGLGVGGIAVALAVQTLLSDLFASLSIGIDKPFEIGDFVVFGDIAGNIEHIGLKTTRIRSLSGEQVVCANAELLAQVLHNYKRMDTRRIVFKFGIAYDTPTDQVRAVSALVERVIKGVDRTRFDRAHFLAFEESRLTFEVVYIVLTSDYNQYMDIQQEINLGLLQGLRELDVRFAFPVRQVEFVGGRLPMLTVAGGEQEQGVAGSESPTVSPEPGPDR